VGIVQRVAVASAGVLTPLAFVATTTAAASGVER
jgi:hypothetical protein